MSDAAVCTTKHLCISAISSSNHHVPQRAPVRAHLVVPAAQETVARCRAPSLRVRGARQTRSTAQRFFSTLKK